MECTIVNPKFANWSDRSKVAQQGGKLTQIDYTDASYLSKVKVFPVARLTDEVILTKFNTIINALKTSTFTETHLRDIVNIALNLKGVTSGDPPLLTLDVNDLTDKAPDNTADTAYIMATSPNTIAVEEFIVGGGGAEVKQPGEDIVLDQAESEASKARAVAFICALFLRLINRPHTHFVLTLTSIKKAYGSLYGKQSNTIGNFNPPITWCEQIKIGLQTYERVRHTISYRLARAEQNLSAGSPNFGLCRYVCFQHIELMGMQIYKMTTECILNMQGVSPGLFLTWIDLPDCSDSISLIYQVGKDLDDASKPDRNRYWKYARYVNPAYFVNLSVSRNKVLAILLIKIQQERGMADSSGPSNPERMEALRNMNDRTKARYTEMASIVIELYDEFSATKGGAGTAWKRHQTRLGRTIGESIRPTGEENMDEDEGEQGETSEEALMRAAFS